MTIKKNTPLFIFSQLFFWTLFTTSIFAQPLDAIGTVQPPGSIITSEAQVGLFISNIVKLIMVVAGLFALTQFLLGGLNYITAGGKQDSPARIKDAQQQIFHAIIGLIVIAGTFLLTAIISGIFFGRPDFILNPTIETL